MLQEKEVNNILYLFIGENRVEVRRHDAPSTRTVGTRVSDDGVRIPNGLLKVRCALPSDVGEVGADLAGGEAINSVAGAARPDEVHLPTTEVQRSGIVNQRRRKGRR